MERKLSAQEREASGTALAATATTGCPNARSAKEKRIKRAPAAWSATSLPCAKPTDLSALINVTAPPDSVGA